MNLKYFGNIDPINIEKYYEFQVNTNGLEIDVDINCEEEVIEPSRLEKVNDFLENIELKTGEAIKIISEDFDLGEDSETAREFLSHHLEVLPKDDIVLLFGSDSVTKDQFMSQLFIERVGFYPEDEVSFVIIDVTFKGKVTNYLMAVTLNENFELSYISMDS